MREETAKLSFQYSGRKLDFLKRCCRIDLVVIILLIFSPTSFMGQRTLIETLKTIVQKRDHTLLDYKPGNMSPDTVPQQSRIKIECKKCGHLWNPKVQTYLARTTQHGGCRGCFNKNIQNRALFPNSPFAPSPLVASRPPRRVGKEMLRQANLEGRFGNIQSREQLIEYLKANPNQHNDYVLPLVLRDTKTPKRRADLARLAPGQFSFHHVIPLHTQGSPENWNMIYLTKEEHDTVHRLRYEVYGEPADLRATYATAADLERSSAEIETVPPEVLKPEARNGVLLARRNPETLKAIEEGMIWTYKTGIQVTLEPNSVETIQDIKELIASFLPETNSDRARMLSNTSSSNNYIREHIATVFHARSGILKTPRASVYGFIVSSLKDKNKTS